MAYLPTLEYELFPDKIEIRRAKECNVLKTIYGVEMHYRLSPIYDISNIGSVVDSKQSKKHASLIIFRVVEIPPSTKMFDFVLNCNEWYRGRLNKTPYLQFTMHGIWNERFAKRGPEEAPMLSFILPTGTSNESSRREFSLYYNKNYDFLHSKADIKKLDLLTLFMENIYNYCTSFKLTISGMQYKKDGPTWCRNIYDGDRGTHINYGKRPEKE